MPLGPRTLVLAASCRPCKEYTAVLEYTVLFIVCGSYTASTNVSDQFLLYKIYDH